jgi:hypothetical protein
LTNYLSKGVVILAIDEKIITTETLSHFKTKQDLENERKFKSKDDSTDLKGAVRYDTAQVLTEQEKAQAKANLGITESGDSGGETVEGAVRYDVQQALNEDDKARARENIGAGDGTWENMPDKPFYKTGTKIEWDGISSIGEPLDYSDTLNVVIYKVGEALLKEDVLGATVEFTFSGEVGNRVVSESNIIDMNEDCFFVVDEYTMPIISVTSKSTVIEIEGVSLEIPSSGVWFIKHYDRSVTSLTTADYSLKQIDKDLLPFVESDTECYVMPYGLLGYTNDKYILYRYSDEIFSEQGHGKAIYKIPSDSFIVPFMLAQDIPTDTTNDLIITIPTEYDSTTSTFSGIEVNLGKVKRELLSDNYIMTVLKKYDGSYSGDFLYNPSSIARLDNNGLIPASMLPSYVDDAIEGYYNEEDSLFYTTKTFDETTKITGESGKIYIDLNTGNTYRWGGSTYVRLNPDEYTLATTSDIDALFT